MKHNKLVFGAIAGSLLTFGIVLKINNSEVKEPRYQAKEDLTANEVYHTGIAGAQEYLALVRSNVKTGKVETEDFLNAREAVSNHPGKFQRASTYNWTEEGPGNIGGRVRAITVDPNDDFTLWAGGVSGGLFISNFKGDWWERVKAFDDNNAVSSIEIMDNGWIYVATGNTFENPSDGEGSGSIGGGLFVSKDNGVSWNVVAGTQPIVPAVNGGWTEINQIKKDVKNPDILWVAGRLGTVAVIKLDIQTETMTEPDFPGFTGNTGIGMDIRVSDNVIIAGIRNGSSVHTFISNDGGTTFTDVSDGSVGNMVSFGLARSVYAISKSDENYVYALLVNSGRTLNGIYQSKDKGVTWSGIVEGSAGFDPLQDMDQSRAQGIYDAAMTVHPTNPENLLVGGITLWKRELGSWQLAAVQGGSTSPSSISVHSDIHTFVWDSQNTLYIGCDGGIYRSEDIYNTFKPVNLGFNVTQFFGIAIAKKDWIYGGTQDNGMIFLDHSSPNNWQEARVDNLTVQADGFSCAISSLDLNARFATAQNGVLERTVDDGINFAQFYSSEIMGLGTPLENLGPFRTQMVLFEDPKDGMTQDSIIFIPDSTMYIGETVKYSSSTLGLPLEYVIVGVDSLAFADTLVSDGDIGGVFYHLYPTNNDTIWMGLDSQLYDVPLDTITLADSVQSLIAVGFNTGQGVWVTRDAYDFTDPQWWRVDDPSSPFSGSVNTMAFSADGDKLYFGTTAGEVYRVSGLDSARTKETADVKFGDPQLKVAVQRIANTGGGSVVTGLSLDPNNPDRLIGSCGRFGNSKSVWFIIDAATTTGTSQDVSLEGFGVNGLPNFPCYSVLVDKTDMSGATILVGTEYGVWSTTNALDVNPIWSEQNNGMEKVPVFDMKQQLFGWNDGAANSGQIYIGTHGRGWFKTGSAVTSVPETEIADNVEGVSNLVLFPNPVNTLGTVEFNLIENGNVNINVFTLSGKIIQSFSEYLNSGENRVNFSAESLPIGTYFISVEADGNTQVSKFVKM